MGIAGVLQGLAWVWQGHGMEGVIDVSVHNASVERVPLPSLQPVYSHKLRAMVIIHCTSEVSRVTNRSECVLKNFLDACTYL